jgi:hypothetical protein
MKSIILIILAMLMMAIVATSPVAASGNSATIKPILGASGGFQSGPGLSETATLIHSAYAYYQANPESAVNIYLIPDMGDLGLTANTPTPFPAFNEQYRVPDVFAAFNQPFPSTMIFQGSSNDVFPVLIPIN